MVSFLGVSSGVCFVPANVAKLSSSAERFPCEHCVCGCFSAAYCWDKCCCHTDEEKLVWAKENGVQPLEFLVDRVRDRHEDGESNRVVPKRACCQKAVGRTQTAVIQDTNHEPSKVAGNCAERGDAEQIDTALRSTTVLLWKVAECRGIDSFWKLLESTSIPANMNCLDFSPLVIGVAPWRDDFALGRWDAPEPAVP